MHQTGVQKLRDRVTADLQQLLHAPISRREQIRLCRQIAQTQDDIDVRNADSKLGTLMKRLEKLPDKPCEQCNGPRVKSQCPDCMALLCNSCYGNHQPKDGSLSCGQQKAR